MSRLSILTLASRIFDQARLVTTMTSGLRPTEQTVLEVKGDRDGAWRLLGSVAFDQTNDLIVSAHPKALNEDIRRAASVLQA